MARKPYFTPEFFAFFRELSRHNNRPWFEVNKERYEKNVRDPLMAFVADFGPRLRTISSNFVADPRPTGGSLFRIYRDIRFAKDKSPFKTAAAVHFDHRRKGAGAPGFYLHLGPNEVYAGGGIYHPEPAALTKIRDAIVKHPDRWKRATARRTLGGDSLKRPPRGYDPEHPLIEDLKRTDFYTGTTLTEKDACAPDFLERYVASCRTAAPLMEFLTEAVGLAW